MVIAPERLNDNIVPNDNNALNALNVLNDQNVLNDLDVLNDQNGPFVHSMAPFQIFIIRAIVGAGFAVLVVRMFYGRVQVVYAAGLAVFMVGMAYVMEYFRKKREDR